MLHSWLYHSRRCFRWWIDTTIGCDAPEHHALLATEQPLPFMPEAQFLRSLNDVMPGAAPSKMDSQIKKTRSILMVAKSVPLSQADLQGSGADLEVIQASCEGFLQGTCPLQAVQLQRIDEFFYTILHLFLPVITERRGVIALLAASIGIFRCHDGAVGLLHRNRNSAALLFKQTSELAVFLARVRRQGCVLTRGRCQAWLCISRLCDLDTAKRAYPNGCDLQNAGRTEQ